MQNKNISNRNRKAQTTRPGKRQNASARFAAFRVPASRRNRNSDLLPDDYDIPLPSDDPFSFDRRSSPPARQREKDRRKNVNVHRHKKSPAERFLTVSVIAAAAAVIASLFIYFHPFTWEDAEKAAKETYSYVCERISDLQEKRKEWRIAREKKLAARKAAEAAKNSAALSPERETIPYIDRSSDMGETGVFDAEPVYIPQENDIFTFMLDTSLGPMLYYSQGDVRWKDYLYGGSDPISRYGCGPVCVAMIINSFSPTGVTPVEMADWSAANGGYARHGGSYHSLIPDSLSAFGLQVESISDRSAENAAQLLRTGHILVALMGRGSLTQNGHFIIIAHLNTNGNVYIADPANYENCTKEWDLQLLMNELKEAYDSGAPLWAVSLPPEG